MTDLPSAGRLPAEIYVAVPLHAEPKAANPTPPPRVMTMCTSYGASAHLLSTKPVRRGPRSGRLESS